MFIKKKKKARIQKIGWKGWNQNLKQFSKKCNHRCSDRLHEMMQMDELASLWGSMCL